MFENILGQNAVKQLAQDLAAGALAPSMVFIGPASSGKGSAALELGRILSCETQGAPWTCPCPACSRQRLLYHPDLLALGSRPFSAEIAAAADTLSRFPEELPVKMLFIRSVRKLLLRFSPVLWEGEPKLAKLAPMINGLEDDLDAIIPGNPLSEKEWAKLSASILKNAQKLEAEGFGEFIPVSQIRRAAYWSRLAPQGKRKLLLIEQADKMQDGARNGLLKLLEEPPPGIVILLTVQEGDSLIPTILSRLRPYRFNKRSRETESEVLRRVFRGEAKTEEPGEGGLISRYLDSFLPISREEIRPAAALFLASLAYQGVSALRPAEAPPSLVALGKYVSPIAEEAGFGRPVKEIGAITALTMQKAEGFAVPGLFRIFLTTLLDLLSESLRREEAPDPRFTDLLRGLVGTAALSSGTYNQSPPLILERFCADFTGNLLALYAPGA